MPFHRIKENFTCEHCGLEVVGDGYTNHCPRCLWSKHVDIHPGDRQDPCGGMMEPITAELIHNKYVITHRCQTCQAVRKNKAAADDDVDLMITLAKKYSDTISRGT